MNIKKGKKIKRETQEIHKNLITKKKDKIEHKSFACRSRIIITLYLLNVYHYFKR